MTEITMYTSTEPIYATVDDLRSTLDATTLDQLTIAAGADQDHEVILRVLGDASRVIDGYLGGRYDVPLVGVPAGTLSILRPHCLAIAKAMFLERRFAGKYDQGAAEARFASEKWLGMVAKRSGASVYGLSDSIADTPGSLSAGSNDAIFVDPYLTDGGALL